MARSAAMEDFARMPPGRKLLVFVAIGAVVGLGYWKLVYKSLDEEVEAAEAEHDGKASTNRRLAGDIPKYEELRTHMTRLRELIEKNQTALPSAPELPAFFETLYHKVAESGAQMGKWTKGSEEPVENFIKVPVDIQVSGTFMQIKRLFASLVQRDVRPSPNSDERGTEQRERIVSIENLALIKSSEKDREIILTAKFTAVTFRQEDKAPPRPANAPGPAGASPAAPPSVPAVPPPLPSAATPTGARARLDD
ncbi:MAG TPA: type 4a pilus biogenesis protein PilO, partial [Kofleriaceae bacterium]